MPSRLKPVRTVSNKATRTVRPVKTVPGPSEALRKSPIRHKASAGPPTVVAANQPDWSQFDYKNSSPREMIATQTNTAPPYQLHHYQSTSLEFLSPPSTYSRSTPPQTYCSPYPPEWMHRNSAFGGHNPMSHDNQYPAFEPASLDDPRQGDPEMRFGNLIDNSPDPLAFNESDMEAFFQNPMDFGNMSPDMDLNPVLAQTSPSNTSIPQTQSSLQDSSGPRNAKRARDDMSRNDFQACWTSSLCPQHANITDGSHPDPATCEGACMPYLFSEPPNSASNLVDESGPIQIQDGFQGQQLSFSQSPDSGNSPSLKRGESFDSEDATSPGEMKAEPNRVQTKRQQPRRTAKVKNEPTESLEASDDVREIPGKSSNARAKGRMPHNQVERKYRESLNAQLEALRAVVPTLQGAPTGCPGETADMEDLPAMSIAGKPSKAMVLANAANYIKKLERERLKEKAEIQRLTDKMKVMEKLVSVGVQPNAGSCNECQVLGWVRGMKLDEGGAEIRLKSM